jgi:hypothetical protein
MRELLLALLVLLTVLEVSLQQQGSDNTPPEDSKVKRLGDKGENKKRDNKKVAKKMLKVASETETMEDMPADPGSDTGIYIITADRGVQATKRCTSTAISELNSLTRAVTINAFPVNCVPIRSDGVFCANPKY